MSRSSGSGGGGAPTPLNYGAVVCPIFGEPALNCLNFDDFHGETREYRAQTHSTEFDEDLDARKAKIVLEHVRKMMGVPDLNSRGERVLLGSRDVSRSATAPIMASCSSVFFALYEPNTWERTRRLIRAVNASLDSLDERTRMLNLTITSNESGSMMEEPPRHQLERQQAAVNIIHGRVGLGLAPTTSTASGNQAPGRQITMSSNDEHDSDATGGDRSIIHWRLVFQRFNKLYARSRNNHAYREALNIMTDNATEAKKAIIAFSEHAHDLCSKLLARTLRTYKTLRAGGDRSLDESISTRRLDTTSATVMRFNQIAYMYNFVCMYENVRKSDVILHEIVDSFSNGGGENGGARSANWLGSFVEQCACEGLRESEMVIRSVSTLHSALQENRALRVVERGDSELWREPDGIGQLIGLFLRYVIAVIKSGEFSGTEMDDTRDGVERATGVANVRLDRNELLRVLRAKEILKFEQISIIYMNLMQNARNEERNRSTDSNPELGEMSLSSMLSSLSEKRFMVGQTNWKFCNEEWPFSEVDRYKLTLPYAMMCENRKKFPSFVRRAVRTYARRLTGEITRVFYDYERSGYTGRDEWSNEPAINAETDRRTAGAAARNATQRLVPIVSEPREMPPPQQPPPPPTTNRPQRQQQQRQQQQQQQQRRVRPVQPPREQPIREQPTRSEQPTRRAQSTRREPPSRVEPTEQRAKRPRLVDEQVNEVDSSSNSDMASVVARMREINDEEMPMERRAPKRRATVYEDDDEERMVVSSTTSDDEPRAKRRANRERIVEASEAAGEERVITRAKEGYEENAIDADSEMMAVEPDEREGDEPIGEPMDIAGNESPEGDGDTDDSDDADSDL